MTEKLKHAILYARFSPRPGASTCESCVTQLAELRVWAESHGYRVDGEFHDDALSGGDDWSDRPGMFAAEGAAKRGMVFLVRSYDRLFRDVAKALAFRAQLATRGVEIISITEEAANGDDPISKMVRSIFLSIAEYQRDIIRARTKFRMLQHQAAGRCMSKKPPWGTKRNPHHSDRLVPNEDEIATAVEIVRRRDAGEGWRAIARAMEARGAERRGKKAWTHVFVQRIYARWKDKPAPLAYPAPVVNPDPVSAAPEVPPQAEPPMPAAEAVTQFEIDCGFGA